jgi:hypothetical protein
MSSELIASTIPTQVPFLFLLTTEETSALLGIPVHSLEKSRSEGRHKIPYIRVGRLIRYEYNSLLDWIDKNRVPVVMEEA